MPGTFLFPPAGSVGSGMLGDGALRDPMTRMAWADALNARRGVADQEEQNRLAGIEHGLYAESRARENPLYGPLESLFTVPGYSWSKASGLLSGRSDPSLDQMAEGYRGMGRGIEANLGDFLNSLTGAPQPVAMPPMTPPMTQLMTEQELADFIARNREWTRGSM
jgi:hypothetical protein